MTKVVVLGVRTFSYCQMVTVNKPSVSTATTTRNASATIASLPSSSGVTQASFDALKRKFQRVNQEIVKQNVMLQEHLARNRQEHHQILQENVRLKGRIVALEGKVREAEGVCHETKVNNRKGGEEVDLIPCFALFFRNQLGIESKFLKPSVNT